MSRFPWRRLEKALFLAVLLVLILLVGPVLIGPRYIEYRFKPDRPSISLAQLERQVGATLQTYRVSRQGRVLTYALGPLLAWAVPSGPPIYVFDEEGRLLDYTLDAGDDQRFSNGWIVDSNFESLLAEKRQRH